MIKKRRTIFTGNSAKVADRYGEIHEGKGINSRIIIEDIIEIEEEKIPFLEGAKFLKLYDVAVPELVKRLTPVEVTFVLLILPLVSYEDCIIRRGNSRQFDVANEREIAELINMEYSKTRRLIKSLIDKGVMGKHETGTITNKYYGKRNRVYTVNPYIFFRGSEVYRTVVDFYSKSGWKELFDKC